MRLGSCHRADAAKARGCVGAGGEDGEDPREEGGFAAFFEGRRVQVCDCCSVSLREVADDDDGACP